jgi:hypothetical protein
MHARRCAQVELDCSRCVQLPRCCSVAQISNAQRAEMVRHNLGFVEPCKSFFLLISIAFIARVIAASLAAFPNAEATTPSAQSTKENAWQR